MPIITAPLTTPPGPEPGPPVLLPEIGYATATYTDPSGQVWPLTDRDGGWFTLADGVSGLGAASYELTSDKHPRGGARLRHAQPQPRTIIWPLFVHGSDHVDFLARWRALATAFTRTLRRGPDGVRMPGILEIARPDGGRRQIEVYYQEGFDGQSKRGYYRDADSAVITLWCEDPYWVDPTPVTVTREASTPSDFLDPFPSVSSSQVLGETVVHNPGDVDVWPSWVITGPASLIEAAHAGTGEAFTLDPDATAIEHGPLLAGQQVTISTDPPQVRYQDGSNWIGSLDWPGATLWGLAPGDNPVEFALTGAGPGSSVQLTFNPRYETA
ncbi:phage tail protein [Streptomyces sp. NPDC006458]|uniref:phage tail protein n=1 Tax=Streptomyces sp. NPDC006458 TaxID=3154302 RepID=UPI0033A9DB05